MITKKQKKLGQVFLQDKNVIQKIIQTAEIKNKDQILEIGPGKGILTEALLKTGAKVIAVEKDQQLVEFLKSFLKDKQNLKIIYADIRDFLKTNQFYTQYSILNTQYKVIGNIPYYLTSHLLRLLLENPIKPSLIVLMIQKEVAERIIAQPPRRRPSFAKAPIGEQGYGGQAKMNLLAVSVQFFAKPEIICYVPKAAFYPKPKLDSAVIKITPIDTDENTDEALKKNFFEVVKAGFKQPRKLLINNLCANLKIKKDKIKKTFKQLNISLNARAQNLSIKQWVSLSSLLMENIV